PGERPARGAGRQPARLQGSAGSRHRVADARTLLARRPPESQLDLGVLPDRSRGQGALGPGRRGAPPERRPAAPALRSAVPPAGAGARQGARGEALGLVGRRTRPRSAFGGSRRASFLASEPLPDPCWRRSTRAPSPGRSRNTPSPEEHHAGTLVPDRAL